MTPAARTLKAAPLVVGLLACSAPSDVPVVPSETAATVLTASSAPAVVAPRGNAAIRVLYQEDWFGGVALIGVDAAGTRAIVRLAAQNPERVYIDTIDLAKGQRTDRWEIGDAAKRKAMLGQGFPASDAMRAEILKLAEIVAALGPSHLRAALPSPTFATNSDRSLVLFGSPASDSTKGDWLFALGADGSSPRRVDDGLTASYSPVVSSDGKTVAFRGCSTSPCDYGVYIGALGQKPRRLMGITGSTPPMFTKDGAHVLAVGDGLNHARCMVKAGTNGRTAADPVFCMRGASDVAVAQDPEGRTAVVSGVKGPAGSQSVDFSWVLLEDGSVLQSRTIERATGSGIVNENGLLAAPMQKGGVVVIDLIASKGPALIDNEGWFFGFDTAHFAGSSLVLLRKPDGGKSYQIVSIDARGLVDASPTSNRPTETH